MRAANDQMTIRGEDIAPRVVCVGGIDPTGAAGLLADVKAVTALGAHASGVVTALTVQTSTEVSDVMVQSASTVRAQLEAVFEEYGADALKTGMLGSVDVVMAVARAVEQRGSGLRLVVDPVLRSSSGRSLLDQDGVHALVRELIPRAALVTPNLSEAALLTGRPVESKAQMSEVADYFLAMGASAVLLKGGHLVDFEPELEELSDLLRTADGDEFWLTRTRIAGPGFRGTGCTLASAIAAQLAKGMTLRSAVEGARDFLERAMHAAPAIGKRARPLGILF